MKNKNKMEKMNKSQNIITALQEKIKGFLIYLAVFDVSCERTLQRCNYLDFLDIKRLNPYYWKVRRIK